MDTMARSKFFLIVFLLLLNPAWAGINNPNAGTQPFNGGKSQIQSSDIGLGGDFPFINLLKLGTSWVATGATLPVNGSQLDSNGYPTALPSGASSVNTTIFVPTQTSRPGNYVLTWTGNGTILCSCNDTLVSGSKTSTTGTGRYVFSTTGNQFTVGIATIGSPYISNMALYHINDEPDYLAGKIFQAKFLSTVRQTGAGVYRFLDLQNANFTNVSTWSTRKPLNYVYYAGGEFRSSFYTTISTSGLAITGSLGAGNPTDRQTAQLQWAATINNPPASVTWAGGSSPNITWTSHGRSTGDIVAWTNGISGGCTPPTGFTLANVSNQQIYYVQSVVDANTITLSATNGGTAIVPSGAGTGGSTCTLSPVVSFQMNGTASAIYVGDERGNFPMQRGFNDEPIINQNATLVYDAGLNLWLKFGTPGTSNTRGYLDNGWPPELFVGLCAQLGMHPYVNVPYLAADAGTAGNKIAGPTDWVSSFVSYVKNSGPSWMIPRVEGPNEEWNSVFYANGYAINKAGLIYGWSGPVNAWYGKVVSIVGQVVNAAYGSGAVDGTQYQILAGMQTHSTTFNSNTTSSSNDRLNAAAFVAAGGSAAYNWATHIDIDQYVAPNDFRTNQEWLWAWDYVKNGTTANLASYIATLDASASAQNFNLGTMNALYGQWAAFAAGFTNKSGHVLKMTGYEGGISLPDAAELTTTTITSTITGLTTAANPCVLAMSTSNIQGVVNSGNPAAINMNVTVSGLGGALGTLLNGNNYAISGVSGNNVSLSVDCTGQSFISNGTATYYMSSPGDAATTMDQFRRDSKLLASNLQGYTYGGVSGSQSNYNNFVTAGVANGTVAEFPSQFNLAGSSANPPYGGSPGTGPNVWGMYDPDIYFTPAPVPAALGIAAFNAH